MIDFAQELNGCSFAAALVIVEEALGIEYEEGELGELEALVARARLPVRGGVSLSAWRDSIVGVEIWFFERVRPYLRCRDPIVSGLAWPRAEYVFEELGLASAARPRTERLLREGTRTLRRFAAEWARGISRDVLRATGKDRLDAALQGPWPLL